MIILFHPRAVRPRNRRFPLAILSIAAVLEGVEEYVIVDGNLDPDPEKTIRAIIAAHKVELLAVSVMPGPQMVSAMHICRAIHAATPQVPIVWGGYFPSLYPEATLNTRYVDFAIKGQGEDTIIELLAALRSTRDFSRIRGLAYKDAFGLRVQTASRPLRSPGDFPELPYHRLGPIEKYLLPTFLGRRTAVHHASIGCPYRCQFCGVVPVYDGKQKTERAQRTANTLAELQRRYGIDAVQFYDNNFFLNESHTRELAELLIPLRLRWWSEGRIDAVLRYSDDTLRALHRAGSAMIFFGAESGSNAALAAMNAPDVQAKLAELGIEVVAPERRSPEYLAQFVVREIEKWAGPIRATGVSMD